MKTVTARRFQWILFATMLILLVACKAQNVRFLEPRGAIVKLPKGAVIAFGTTAESREIPFTHSFGIGSVHEIELEFDDDFLRAAGFTQQEIAKIHERNSARMKGELVCPAEAKIPALFKLTVDQVRAVVLNDKVVYWKYWDEEGRVILSFEGFPGD
jgi:hypothetical protein